jgi:hypothetical protein
VNSNGRTQTLRVVEGSESLISSAGGSLLAQTVEVSGLRKALSKELAPWRSARARHDPGKIVLGLAVAVALGGDCLADVGVVRAQQCHERESPGGATHLVEDGRADAHAVREPRQHEVLVRCVVVLVRVGVGHQHRGHCENLREHEVRQCAA